MMHKLSNFLRLCPLFLSLSACAQNECEDALDRIDLRSEECNLKVGESAHDAAEECTEAEGKSFQCQADCNEDATCEAINRSDEDAFNALLACLTTCATY